MAKNRVIYVVRGTTGEYSGRREWPVVAYTEEEDAQAHVAAAAVRAREIQSARPNRYTAPKGLNEFDSEMYMDYTGTDYFYFKVELRDKR